MRAIKKQSIPCLKIIAFLAVFSLIYAINFVLPLEKSLLPFFNIDNRAWHWCEFLILGLAIFYIFKIKNLAFKDVSISIVLGLIVYFSQSNIGYGYISSIVTTVCYYSACQILRLYSQQDKFFDLGVKNTAKSFFKGVLYAIPFALINILAIYFTYANQQIYNFEMLNIIPQAKNALAPGISEEIIWHFFLLAFVVDLFGGSIPKNKLALSLTYILTVIPHCLIHLPTVFVENPIMAVLQLIFISVLFGFPMVWLVKNKNLQTSIGFHWAVDFLRFLFLPW